VHAELGIATEAWAPLGRGSIIGNPVLTGIAQKYGRSEAQVILRWHLQRGTVVIPKSATPSRIIENIQVFDFELTYGDITAIAALDDNGRTGKHPNGL
jgi:diketogulonate reductase-like aldo/keto reductase